jgi:ABC-2 type transport system ATP-binding protein
MNTRDIRVENVSHWYGHKMALNHIDLHIPSGSICAVLGRNGSGKSTLLRIILGLLHPTQGQAQICGKDSRHLSAADRGRIGYVPENHPLLPLVSVRAYARLQAAHYGQAWRQDFYDILLESARVRPSDFANSLSRGQRAMLSLALVLATRPQVLILDDPSLGLDPLARGNLIQALLHLKNEDPACTIVIASHQSDEIERLADHLVILDGSVLRVSAPIDVFRASIRLQHWQRTVGDLRPPPVPGLLRWRQEGDLWRVLQSSGSFQLPSKQTPNIPDHNITILSDEPAPFDEAIAAILSGPDSGPALAERLRSIA